MYLWSLYIVFHDQDHGLPIDLSLLLGVLSLKDFDSLDGEDDWDEVVHDYENCYCVDDNDSNDY